MTIKRNLGTPESRAFWAAAVKSADGVKDWPAHRMAGINTGDGGVTMGEIDADLLLGVSAALRRKLHDFDMLHVHEDIVEIIAELVIPIVAEACANVALENRRDLLRSENIFMRIRRLGGLP